MTLSPTLNSNGLRLLSAYFFILLAASWRLYCASSNISCWYLVNWYAAGQISPLFCKATSWGVRACRPIANLNGLNPVAEDRWRVYKIGSYLATLANSFGWLCYGAWDTPPTMHSLSQFDHPSMDDFLWKMSIWTPLVGKFQKSPARLPIWGKKKI